MRKQFMSMVSVLAITGLALTGCGTSSTPSTSGTPAPNTSTAKTPTTKTSTVTSTTVSSTKQAVAEISSKTDTEIKGTATLSLNTKTGDMLVTVNVSGLKPNSTHPEHIHSGTVDKPGPVVYPLNNLVADAKGDASQTTTIKNVKDIPASGWIVNIHEGPGMTGTQGQQLAAGSVTLK